MRNRCIGNETEEGRRRRREKWEKIPSKQNYKMKNGTKQISWGFYLCKFSRTKCWKNSWAIKEAGMDREKLTSIRARLGEREKERQKQFKRPTLSNRIHRNQETRNRTGTMNGMKLKRAVPSFYRFWNFYFWPHAESVWRIVRRKALVMWFNLTYLKRKIMWRMSNWNAAAMVFDTFESTVNRIFTSRFAQYWWEYFRYTQTHSILYYIKLFRKYCFDSTFTNYTLVTFWIKPQMPQWKQRNSPL